MSAMFETQAAYSPENQQLVKGALFTTHDVDTGEALPTLDSLGSPLILMSDSNGFLPPFKVAGDRTQVEIRNGTFKTILTTLAGTAEKEVVRAISEPGPVKDALSDAINTAIDEETTAPGGVVSSAIGTAVAPKLDATAAADLYASKAAIVRNAPRIRRQDSLIVTAGGGSFQGQDSTSDLADTTDKVLGTSTAKLVSSGTGGGSYYTLPAVTFNLTAKTLRLYLKLDTYAHVSNIFVDAGDPGSPGPLSSRYRKYIGENLVGTDMRGFREGEWLALDLPRGEFALDAGTPNWAAITRIRVGIIDDGTGNKVTLRINGAATVPDLTGPIVALTLDDSFVGQRNILFPILDARGIPATLFPILDQQSTLSYADMRARRDLMGWEIGMHAVSNSDHAQVYSGLTAAQYRDKFNAIKLAMNAEGIATDVFAWPVGNHDNLAEQVATEYVSFAAGVTDLVQPAGFTNPMRLCRQQVVSTKTLAQLKAQFDKAKASNAAIIPMIHNVVASGATGTSTTTSIITDYIDYMIAQGAVFTTLSGLARSVGAIS